MNKNKKVLFVAHMDSHIANFHLPYLKWFQENGYETHVASNSLEKTKEIMYCDVKHQINFQRSPFSLKNIKAYKEFKKILKDNDFLIVHSHTPMGGLFTRLAFKKKKTKVFYTAHGFHFLKGGSKLAWLLFYPIEKRLSKYTDELITINKEDYEVAIKNFSNKANITLINGVGVSILDYQATNHIEQQKLKDELKISDNDFVMTYVGEQTKGKDQKFLIENFPSLLKIKNNLKLILVGYGKELENNRLLIKKMNLENNILSLGYRTDIKNILTITNLFVTSSLREGLPKAVLEALAAGKPLLVSDVRGNRDLVVNGFNGYTYQKKNLKDFLDKFQLMIKDNKKLDIYGANSKRLAQNYDLDEVLKEVTELYKKYL